MPEDLKADLVISYHRVRTALGLMGMCLPVALLVGGLMDLGVIEPSISDFYHTTYRDIYVGTLTAIGVFLLAYRGHRKSGAEWIADDMLATLAGAAAIALALFPNESPSAEVVTVTQSVLGLGGAPLVHYAAGIVFCLCLAAMNFFKFARTCRMGRRRIYLACGWIILGCMVGLFLASFARVTNAGGWGDWVSRWRVIFVLEALGIWAFGLSWLVKGRADLAMAMRVQSFRDYVMRLRP